MTTPDTTAIRAQMEALTGFIPGPWGLEDEIDVTAPDGVDSPWYVAKVTDACGSPKDLSHENARLIAAAPDMHATILALCDEVDRLRTIIDNLHHVEQKHREAANTHFHRANRLRAESDLLRAALTSIERIGIAHSDSFARQIKEAQDIARAALGREGDA